MKHFCRLFNRTQKKTKIMTQAKVGIFFFVNGDIVLDTVSLEQG